MRNMEQFSDLPPFGTSDPGGLNGPPLTQVPSAAISFASPRWPSL